MMSTQSGEAARGVPLPPAVLDDLRPHLVNLTRGRLSSTGLATTTAQDLDAIFEQSLPAFVDRHGGRDVPVVIWAHGGLVDEASGLRIAHRHVRWWREDGVYPIFFTWETGVGDALGQLFAGWVGARGVLDDASDRLAEWTARHLGGRKMWDAMKLGAELAATPHGGAELVAERLGRYVAAHPGAVRLHAVGHSAGSIFHRHFLDRAAAHGARFAELALLAPAIRADEFLAHVAPRLGPDVERLSLFTMDRAHEAADVCALGSAAFYHHSLLMFIRAALEDLPGVPILGLQESLQSEPALWRLFGPGHDDRVEVIWSPTRDQPLAASSTSTSHGGFDDDPPTVESLFRRFTGRAPARPFPLGADRSPDVVGTPFAIVAPGAVVAPPPPPVSTGPRRALCVGIDAYPAPHRLAGCVADARSWAVALEARGFVVDLLLDDDATRQAIVDRLVALVGSASPGDVVLFQYAGHGTSVDDVDGDEPLDEALCPVDFASGALLVDDDLRAIFGTLGTGVNLTCFLDCCHSATATRDAFAAAAARDEPGTPRFIPADDVLQAAHRAFRLRTGAGPAAPGTRGTELMREATFSACLETEVAYETGGRGDYSRAAVPLLAAAADGLDNQAFQEQIDTHFAHGARQRPWLDSAPSVARRAFLAPVVAAPTPTRPAPPTGGGPPGPGGRPGHSATAALLHAVADLLDDR